MNINFVGKFGINIRKRNPWYIEDILDIYYRNNLSLNVSCLNCSSQRLQILRLVMFTDFLLGLI